MFTVTWSGPAESLAITTWDNIRMDLRQIGWTGVDWIQVAQYRDHWWAFVNMVINLRVP